MYRGVVLNKHLICHLNLQKKKEDYARLIEEKGLLTEEIKNAINNATKLVELEEERTNRKSSYIKRKI